MPPPGLTSPEAAARRRVWGFNRLEPSTVQAPWRHLLRLIRTQFGSPLVAILGVGAALALMGGSGRDAALVLVILVTTGSLGVAQAWRAERATQALARELSPTARVWRDGQLQTLPTDQIVPDDLIDLRAGDLIAADAELVAATNLTVVEASLTGESMPVEKTARPEADHRLWAGCSVRSGTGTARVLATGARTRLGALSQPLSRPRRISPFMQGVADFGSLLMKLLLLIVVLALVGQAAQQRPLLEGVLLAMALAVGLSPELLPVIVSVTLSSGAWRLSRHGVLLRRLDAMEDLGTLDLLCTDKTGTLTEGRMRLVSAVDIDGRESVRVRALAVCNARLQTGMANPLDDALVALSDTATPPLGPTAHQAAEIPYDFVRRRLTVAVAVDAASVLLITKGAVLEVMACCTEDLSPTTRTALQARFEALSRQGLRVLAVATRTLPAGTPVTVAHEAHMRLEGLLMFEDPPRADAHQTLGALSARGVKVKLITGDNRHVAQAVARSVGLPDTPLVTGAELVAMRDEALWHHARTASVLAEIDPQQKEQIVRALQRHRHVVGFLGDGINDAPALSAADVGISVQGAADVARHSADLVLTRPDLQKVIEAVDEGRRSFANTRKYMVITASANFGNMLSMAAGTWLLPFAPMTAQQILLNNLLSDLPALTLSGDRVAADDLKHPRRWNPRDLRRDMLVFGLISTVFDLLLFAVLRAWLQAPEPDFQTVWFIASLSTEVAVLLMLRSPAPLCRSHPSVPMLSASAAVLVVGIALASWAPTAALWGFQALRAPTALAVVISVCTYVACTEALKRRLWAPGAAAPHR